MKFPRIITRRRFKWAGLAATVCVATAMIASYWFWPSFFWLSANSPGSWTIGVTPGGIYTTRFGADLPPQYGLNERWHFKSRFDPPGVTPIFIVRTSTGGIMVAPQTYPIVWLAAYEEIGMPPGLSRRVFIPLWMPLVLIALPTGVLFYRDRKPKPGCCTKCRYDLTGLNGNTCPECGTKIAKTDSHKAPASPAEGEDGVGPGENGAGLGENGAGLEGNGVS